MKKTRMIMVFFLLLAVSVFGIIDELDSEPHDLADISSLYTVLTDTPDASNDLICQALIVLGDDIGAGPDRLDGTGGLFRLSMTIGGHTIQPSPQIFNFGTEPESAIWTSQFPVPAGQEVVIKILSPNPDTEVDITAYLYNVFPVNVASGVVESDVQFVEGSDATDAIGTAVWSKNVDETSPYTFGGALDAVGTEIKNRTNNPSLNQLLAIPDVANRDIRDDMKDASENALSAINLEYLMFSAIGEGELGDRVDGHSALGLIVGKSQGSGYWNYNRDTDSLEAIRDFLDIRLDAILADTSAVDTTSKMRTFLTGANTPVAKDSTPLTVLEIRAAVWNALTASYGDPNTYGAAMEDVLADTATTLPATLAAIPAAGWAVVMENGKSYAEVMRVFAAVLSGKTSIASDEITFTGIDGTTERLKVTVSRGARTSVDTWDGGP